jgi:hypothetical protein
MRKASESRNIRSLDYDHRFISSVDTLFRADYTNLTLGVVHISIGESSEIHFSALVGGGDPVNKRMSKGGLRRIWCDLVLGKMVQLQQNVMNMHSGKHGSKPGPTKTFGCTWACSMSGNALTGFCIIDQKKALWQNYECY